MPIFGRYRARARRAAGAGVSAVVDAVYPPRCAAVDCGRRGTWLCPDCDAALRRLAPPWCARCGDPVGPGRCRCADLVPELAAIRSLAPFGGWLRDAIIAFKYQDEWARAAHLGTLLELPLASLGTVDALVPVPLHPARERRRGYNQAALLARQAGHAARVPVLEALVRVRDTPQQVGLEAAARHANVAGAFAMRDGGHVAGLRVVLIDDVLTTGATLGACAETLLAAGAAEVRAVTLAR